MSKSQGSERRQVTVDLVLTVAIGAAALVLIWTAVQTRAASRDVGRRLPEVALPSDPISLDGASLSGSLTAPLVLLVFSDFECPYCARFSEEVLPQIRRHYSEPGKVQLAFWNFPLPIHANARGAAAAAECAGDQEHFWEFHDVLFSDIINLSRSDVVSRAVRLGLDRAAFELCLGDQQAMMRVDKDIRLGQQLGVMGTPAMFVGKRQTDGSVLLSDRLSGARPFSDFRSAFDRRMQQ